MSLEKLKKIIEMLSTNYSYLNYEIKVTEEEGNYNIKIEINEDEQTILIIY